MIIKGKFRQRYTFPEVSRDRMFAGIFLGIFVSIVFYLFFNSSREVMRIVFSISEYHDLWVFSEKELRFYNLMFAFISTIFGEGLCLKLWYDRPNLGYKPFFNYRRKSIINDISMLNISFLFLFTKIAVAYGIWMGESYWYLSASIYPKYNYIWILLIIVLHLEQWKTIRLIFPKGSLKALILFTVAIIGFAFFLSFVNPMDIKAINYTIQRKSVDLHYDLERPESGFASYNKRRSLVVDVYLVYPKNQQLRPDSPSIIMYGEKITPRELESAINWELERYRPKDRDQVILQLHCDKNITMKQIKELKEIMIECGIRKLSYAVTPQDHQLHPKTYRNYGIRSTLPDSSAIERFEENSKNIIELRNAFSLEILSSDSVLINGIGFISSDIPDIIIQPLVDKKIQLIQLYPDDETTLETYIAVRDQVSHAILTWRNMLSQGYYSKVYNELNSREKAIIRNNASINFIEVPTLQR